MTKNKDGRIVYLTPELKSVLVAQLGRIIPDVFPYPSGPHCGQERRGFRKAWAAACKRAGAPGHIAHDFRRTAVRNLERVGVPRSVAMKTHRPQDGGGIPALRDRQ